MKDTTFGFIGLGLIGGSIAKGIKRACPDARIMAYICAPAQNWNRQRPMALST